MRNGRYSRPEQFARSEPAPWFADRRGLPARLSPHLEPVTLEYRRSLYEADATIEFVWFIETGVGSLVNTMANGDAAEVGTIGNEGMVGLPLILGDHRAPTAVYVQVPGSGLRMRMDCSTKNWREAPRCEP